MLLLVSMYFVGLVAATLVHEFGHLVADGVLRCDPRLICIGVGRAVARRRVGRIWVVLRALPIGGYVLLPPRPEDRRLVSLCVTAAGPAANVAAMVLLQAIGDRLPDDVWFMMTLSQALFLVGTLVPYTTRVGGTPHASDGLKILAMLAGRPRYRLRASYGEAASRMHPEGGAPAMTPAFADIVLQQTRPDRRESWGRRQAIDALEGVIAGTAANAVERALARAVLHGYVDAEQQIFRRERRPAPATTPAATPAATSGAVASVAETARIGPSTWLWVAVAVIAVVGPIYDQHRRSIGEEGRLDGSHLRFAHREGLLDGHRLVSLQGTIGGDAIVELREAIGRYGLAPGDILLLDSPGGEVGNAAAMGRMIRKHGLATAVGTLRDGRIEPADCASACVALFAAGTARMLPEGSRLGIHRFSSVGTGDMSASEISHSEHSTARREVAYFAEMGVAPALAEEAARIPPQDIRWLSPEEALGLRLATARGDGG